MPVSSSGRSAAESDKQDESPAGTTTRVDAKRINVAVTPEVVQALQNVIDREHISLTEAVRRLIGYGDFVYQAIRRDGYDVRLVKDDEVREVVLL